MPNQSMAVEADQPSQWPPPILASFEDKSMEIIDATNQPVLNSLSEYFFHLTPSILIDTIFQQPYKSSYTHYKPKAKPILRC